MGAATGSLHLDDGTHSEDVKFPLPNLVTSFGRRVLSVTNGGRSPAQLARRLICKPFVSCTKALPPLCCASPALRLLHPPTMALNYFCFGSYEHLPLSVHVSSACAYSRMSWNFVLEHTWNFGQNQPSLFLFHFTYYWDRGIPSLLSVLYCLASMCRILVDLFEENYELCMIGIWFCEFINTIILDKCLWV